MRRVIAATVLVGLSGLACGQKAEPETPRDPTPLAVAPTAMDPGVKSAEELLDQLEQADRDLRSLTADVLYDKTHAIAGDRELRLGRLSFINEPPATPGGTPRRRFRIEFSSLRIGNRLEEEPKIFIFDGMHIAEVLPNEKIWNREQVVPPGEEFDALRIGKGPMPIPIGQRKDDILSRFEASLPAVDDGLVPENPEGLGGEDHAAMEALVSFARQPGMAQLKLVPRPGVDSRMPFREVRLWYRKSEKGQWLPMMARTVADQDGEPGDVSVVQLVNPMINGGHGAAGAGAPGGPGGQGGPAPDPADFRTERPEGWDGHTEAWRDPINK